MEKTKHLSLNRRRLYVVSAPFLKENYRLNDLLDKLNESGIPDESILINKENNDSSLIQGETTSRIKKELITVVVDPNCSSEQEKNSYHQIAKNENLKACFIDINNNIDEIKNYANNGDHGEMYQTIVNKGRFYINGLKTDSSYDRIIYDSDYSISFEDNNTQLKLDSFAHPEINKNEGIITDFSGYIVGDIHGMYDDMISSLEKLGFNTENNQAEHPKGKKILFLGDLVDRGKKSAETLDFVMNTVKSGNGYMINGNHEMMLFDALDKVINKDGQAIPDSLASGDTLASVIRYPKENFAEEAYNFIKNSPTSLRLLNNGIEVECIHAPGKNIEGITTKKERTHGKNIGVFDDSGFREVKNHNKKITICGHMEQPSEIIESNGKKYSVPINVPNVVSLDYNGCSTTNKKQGYLGFLDFDKMNSINQLKGYPLAKSCVLSIDKFETSPNPYRFEIAKRKKLAKELGEALDSDDIDIIKSGNYYSYLPKPSIYEEGRMYEKPIYPDIAGSIGVDNGMKVLFIGPSKPYTIGDEVPILNKDQDIMSIENVRGFNAMVSRDEYGKGLIVTTASRDTDSRYKKMAEDTLKESGVYDKLNTLLGSNDRNMTLTFKVRHPDDKRNQISQDNDKESYGATLVSARKNEAYSPMLSEKYLNYIAMQVGVDRPNVQKIKFSQVSDYKKDINDIRENKVDINNIDGKPLVIRTRKENNMEIYSDHFILPTAQSTVKKVMQDLTPKKIDEIIETRGNCMKRNDFFYQKTMTKIINDAIKSKELDSLKQSLDLKAIRENSSLTPDEKRKQSKEGKDNKIKIVLDSVETAFDSIYNSEQKCNPVKFYKIKDNKEKVEKEKELEKEYKKRRQNKSSFNPN